MRKWAHLDSTLIKRKLSMRTVFVLYLFSLAKRPHEKLWSMFEHTHSAMEKLDITIKQCLEFNLLVEVRDNKETYYRLSPYGEAEVGRRFGFRKEYLKTIYEDDRLLFDIYMDSMIHPAPLFMLDQLREPKRMKDLVEMEEVGIPNDVLLSMLLKTEFIVKEKRFLMPATYKLSDRGMRTLKAMDTVLGSEDSTPIFENRSDAVIGVTGTVYSADEFNRRVKVSGMHFSPKYYGQNDPSLSSDGTSPSGNSGGSGGSSD